MVPDVPGPECASPDMGPWAEPLHVSLDDILCKVPASQRCETQMRSCF